MRLRLKEEHLDNIIIETDGFYDTIEWMDVPVDKMVIFSPSKSDELIVAFNKFQFDDLNSNLEYKRAYVVPKQIVEHMTSGELTYCSNYENRISLETPQIEDGLIEEVQRKLDNNTLLMFLLIEQSDHDKTFDTSCYTGRIQKACETSVYKDAISFDTIDKSIQEKLNFTKFIIRSSLYTERWPEPYITLLLNEIISKVLIKHFGTQERKEETIFNFYKLLHEQFQIK